MENSSCHSSKSTSNNSLIREEGVMDMYLRSLKESIDMGKKNFKNKILKIFLFITHFLYIEISTHFREKQEYSFTYKELKYQNNLLIEVKLPGCTEINQFTNDILFYIKINESFPESAPIVTCNSNVKIIIKYFFKNFF
jgi:hypothetical protein